ncbi:MAG: hypothetical protein EZS28_030670, partial [Streblomastix strix]
GYYLLNTDIQNLPNSANGDYAFSTESGTVWMFDAAWYNSGDIDPDQITPASDTTPLSDGTATAGISTEYSRVDHVHPLSITTTIPISDSASGSVDRANYYARSDHSHPINIATIIPAQDSASGSVVTTNYYARNDHFHPINEETNASNIPIVDGVGDNGTSAFYARHGHVHPQQLTYDGNNSATKFIKTGGTNSDILIANGKTQKQNIANNSNEFKIDTRSGFGKLQFNQHWSNGTGISTYLYQIILSLATGFSNAWILYFDSDVNRYGELWCLIDSYSYNTIIYQTSISALQVDAGTDQTLTGIKTFYKALQVIPSSNGTFNEGIRISRYPTNQRIKIQVVSDPNSNSGKIDNQWLVGSTGNNSANPLGFAIVKAGEEGQADGGLQISADGNTLSFNGQVIAGGSVNYSQDNTILWGTKSLGTDGGFYTNGITVFWRDHQLQFDPFYQR